MKFLLSDDQLDLQKAVRDFAVEVTDAGARRNAFEGADGFDEGFWTGLMEMGVAGIAIPEEHGGLGMDVLDLALISEALGYAGAPGPFLGHVIAAHTLNLCGSDAQKAKWLPKLASGEAVATFAFAEAKERYWPGQWQAGLEGGKLTGEKTDVLYPERADLIVVGVKGGFALVERDAGQAIEAKNGVDRTRRIGNVSFSGVAAEAMPADEAQAQKVIDAVYVLLAADGYGGATRLLEMTTDYAKTREQFGQVIGRFQGVKHQLADMAVEIEPSRGIYWYAAHAYDKGLDDQTRVAALAKAHLGDIFMQAARSAVMLHGGIGYTWDYDAQIWLKRAMFNFAYLGAPSRHRQRAADLAGW